MAYVWTVGVFYSPDKLSGTQDLQQYVLEEEELESICGRLPGIPVTWEHLGIEAVSKKLIDNANNIKPIHVIKKLNQEAVNNPIKKPVGIVSDAWRAKNGEYLCLIRINRYLFPGTAYLVCTGCVQGLSLTHVKDPGSEAVPLEISLCLIPARPGCYFHSIYFSDFEKASSYKTFTENIDTSRLIMEAEPSVAAPKAELTMQSVLASLSQDKRQLVKAAFDEMDSELKKKEKEATEATSSLEQFKKASEVDKMVLKDTIKRILSQIPEKEQQTYQINEDDCTKALIEQSDPRALRMTDRLLMACSRSMMSHSQPVAQHVKTNKRSFSETKAAEPSAPAAVSQKKSLSLRDKLRSAFENYEEGM